jgi:hypothetical protein
MGWTAHEARMGLMRNARRIWFGTLARKSHLRDTGVDG